MGCYEKEKSTAKEDKDVEEEMKEGKEGRRSRRADSIRMRAQQMS